MSFRHSRSLSRSRSTVSNVMFQQLIFLSQHLLRGETGVYYEDLYSLICFLPRYALANSTVNGMLSRWEASKNAKHPLQLKQACSSSSTLTDESMLSKEVSDAKHPPQLKHACLFSSTLTNTSTLSKEIPSPTSSFWRLFCRSPRNKTFDPEKTLAVIPTHCPLKPAYNPPSTTLYDYLPFLLIFKWIWKKVTGDTNSVLEPERRDSLGRKVGPSAEDSNVPLEITNYLSGYCACTSYISAAPLVCCDADDNAQFCCARS